MKRFFICLLALTLFGVTFGCMKDTSSRGQVESNTDKFDKSTAVRLPSNDAMVYLKRGDAWSEKGDYGKAIIDFNKAIRLDPTNAPAYLIRGEAWSNKKDYDKAIIDLNEAIRLDPTDASAYLSRGRAWGGKGDYDKAIIDLNEVIRLDPTNVSVRKFLNMALEEKGN